MATASDILKPDEAEAYYRGVFDSQREFLPVQDALPMRLPMAMYLQGLQDGAARG